MSCHRRSAYLLAGVLVVSACVPQDAMLRDSATLEASPTAANPGASHSAASGTDIARLRSDVVAVIDRLRSNKDGEVYANAVKGTRADDIAIAVVLIDGRSFALGETDARFPLMSVSKPFTYALAIEQRGIEFMIERIGASATGFPYNAVAAGAVRPTSEQNPFVNAGAIATISYVVGDTPAQKTVAVLDLYSRLAGEPLSIEPDWQAEPRALTYTLAYQMKAADRLDGDVTEAATRYLQSNIVAVDVAALASMGATFANDGIQPVTGERVLAHDTVRTVLSVMAIAGMYEESGRWWTEVGLPAKSGVSGAIVAVVPGWGSIVAYSPRLDPAGNSVIGGIAIRELATRWGLHSFERLLDGDRLSASGAPLDRTVGRTSKRTGP